MTLRQAPRLVADRLYGVQFRPHELALYGETLRVRLDYVPMCGDPPEATTTHFRLLVLEGEATVPPEVAPEGRLLLVKVGWEAELSSELPVPTPELGEGPDEVSRLLKRIAETINELARRAGLEAPFGPEVVAKLLADWRRVEGAAP